MDLAFIREYTPLYVEAAKLTIGIALFGILFSIVVGALCSIIRYYKVPVLQKIAGIYIELSRNTPLLVQLFFLYFGLPKIGIHFSSESCAVIGLTFLGGSYMAEAFRSGLEAVDEIQRGSALALGFNSFQVMWHVILPQAISVSVPAFCANIIFLIKETSIFSVIAIPELTNTALDLIGLYYRSNEYLFVLVIAYAIILIPLSLILTWLERRVRYGTFGN